MQGEISVVDFLEVHSAIQDRFDVELLRGTWGFQNIWYYGWKPRVERGGFAVLRATAPVAQSR